MRQSPVTLAFARQLAKLGTALRDASTTSLDELERLALAAYETTRDAGAARALVAFVDVIAAAHEEREAGQP